MSKLPTVKRLSAVAPGQGGAWWSLSETELCEHLRTTPRGLSRQEAAERLARMGPNELTTTSSLSLARAVATQLKSPLVGLLIVAAGVSVVTGARVDAVLVASIVVGSVMLGAFREHRAYRDAALLRRLVEARARVIRDGVLVVLPVRDIVPGDVVELAAGARVPADARILAAHHLFVNEAALTGEGFPVEKFVNTEPPEAPLSGRRGCVHLGTQVHSGSGRVLVVATGPRTTLGGIAQRLSLTPPDTEFDRGLRRFGLLLARVMIMLVLSVFTLNLVLRRPPAETLLFALALAVGLSPELLPALLSINLSRGASLMARRGVLVRRQNAIENLGSMEVLCTDKTGTLTVGRVALRASLDDQGLPSNEVLRLAALNAFFQQGPRNPLDDEIVRAAIERGLSLEERKLAEIPWDFVRKRVSVLVASPARTLLVTKGAVSGVLGACDRRVDGSPLAASDRAALLSRIDDAACAGIRVLAVATRTVQGGGTGALLREDDQSGLTFVGTLAFVDPPRADAQEAVKGLHELGVAVKMITGDVSGVARFVAREVGLSHERVLTGRELDDLSDEALCHVAAKTDLFVEVDPNQKERILLSLKKSGHVVGFLGDGINDAPAMHVADTSISVDTAVDVAREAADFVLLSPDLGLLREGVREGRRIFANTLTYVLTTTSANLGNMVSMAATSGFLTFFPLTAGQILLNNFLSDIPAFGIADDRVDEERMTRPPRWDERTIGRFMVQFGLLSSVFDGLTFLVLLRMYDAQATTFRTAWFVESLLTELVIALVVRTRGPFWRSRPGSFLLGSTVVLIVVAFALPSSPFAGMFGFVPLSGGITGALVVLTLGYVVAAEVLKRWFFSAS
jgi:Mg2+-importing ATPase